MSPTIRKQKGYTMAEYATLLTQAYDSGRLTSIVGRNSAAPS